MKTPVYIDDNCNKLELFLNQDSKVFLGLSSENSYQDAYIVLDKEDIKDIIKELKTLLSKM